MTKNNITTAEINDLESVEQALDLQSAVERSERTMGPIITKRFKVRLAELQDTQIAQEESSVKEVTEVNALPLSKDMSEMIASIQGNRINASMLVVDGVTHCATHLRTRRSGHQEFIVWCDPRSGRQRLMVDNAARKCSKGQELFVPRDIVDVGKAYKLNTAKLVELIMQRKNISKTKARKRAFKRYFKMQSDWKFIPLAHFIFEGIELRGEKDQHTASTEVKKAALVQPKATKKVEPQLNQVEKFEKRAETQVSKSKTKHKKQRDHRTSKDETPNTYVLSRVSSTMGDAFAQAGLVH